MKALLIPTKEIVVRLSWAKAVPSGFLRLAARLIEELGRMQVAFVSQE